MVRFRVDLKRELEALKRRADSVYRTGARITEPPPKRPSGPLAELVPGEQQEAGGECFYRVAAPAETIWDDAPQFHTEYLEALRSPFPPGAEALEGLQALQEVRPEEICYLDLETTGLSMAPLFLVGLMYSSGEDLVVDQLFARDYTEERAVLVHTVEMLKGYRVLVTFNGIRFDVPFLEERMIYTGLELGKVPVHVDLLPIARRVLKKRTPNHKLQTLERYLCNRKRIGDVPGSEIPGVYHEYVRTQNAGDIAGVFHHNRLDLLTMLQLVTVFLSRSE
jgi:uncharacterized protein YprB with RNaseH-like and TPR domain